MKKNGLWKKITSAALISAMVMSMGGMTAFAETQDVTFTKTITKDRGTYTPKVDISFSVSPAQGGTDKNGKTVYDGIEGGVTFKTAASFTASETTVDAETDSGTVTLSIDKDKFYDKNNNFMPGIYRYTLTETDPNYDGLVPSNRNYNLDVYVSLENNVETFTSFMYVATDSNAEKVGNVDNDYETNNLTVKKLVSGNQADKNKDFSFTIKITGQSGETYKVVKTKQDNTTVSYDWVCGADNIATGTISLKDTETIEVKGLSKSDTYEVVESDEYFRIDGYEKPAITGADNVSDYTATGNVANGDDEVVYTNTKSATTPTGIVLSFAPYILIVALAGVFAVLFLRKKREEF